MHEKTSGRSEYEDGYDEPSTPDTGEDDVDVETVG